MKLRHLFVFLVMIAPMSVRAFERVEKPIGPLTLSMPLQTLEQVQLYEFSTNKGYLGAETLVLSYKDYGLRVGAVIDYVGVIRMPIVTLQTRLQNKVVSIDAVKFGVWYGYDKENVKGRHHWGIIGSLNLW
jgi:hypothetical protein